MTTGPCSRCGSYHPNPSCFVCCEMEEEEPKPYDECDDYNPDDDLDE